jgi:hypothetical protein
MALTPRKTYPELTSQTTVVDSDLLASYRSPGPLKKVAASVVGAYARAPLAIATPGAQGAGLIGVDSGLTLPVPLVLRDYVQKGVLLASRCGVVGGGSSSATANTTKIQSAINDCAGEKAFVFDVEDLWLDGNITVPVGADNAVDIHGMGSSGPKVLFTGSAVTEGFVFAGDGTGQYLRSGGVYDLNVQCTSGAKRAITFRDLNHPNAIRNTIQGCDGAGIYVYGSLMTHTQRNLLIGCGNASECAIVVTGDDANVTGAIATHYLSFHDRISGGLAGGATTKKGGYSIDRCSTVDLISVQAESTGVPIILAGQASSNRGVFGVRISGAGLENPGNNNPYIDAGQGWTGAAGQAVIGATLFDVRGTVTGTTASTYGVRFKNTTGVAVGPGVSFGMTLGAVSTYEFESTGNTGYSVESNNAQFGDAWDWVRVNGVMQPDATPQANYYWRQDSVYTDVATIAPASTISIQINTSQGGIYNRIFTFGSAATINNITIPTGLRVGTKLTILAADNNATLGHLAGGSGQIKLRGGSNLALATGDVVELVYNSFPDARWVQP